MAAGAEPDRGGSPGAQVLVLLAGASAGAECTQERATTEDGNCARLGGEAAVSHRGEGSREVRHRRHLLLLRGAGHAIRCRGPRLAERDVGADPVSYTHL